jgi:hypothetical protein
VLALRAARGRGGDPVASSSVRGLRSLSLARSYVCFAARFNDVLHGAAVPRSEARRQSQSPATPASAARLRVRCQTEPFKDGFFPSSARSRARLTLLLESLAEQITIRADRHEPRNQPARPARAAFGRNGRATCQSPLPFAHGVIGIAKFPANRRLSNSSVKGPRYSMESGASKRGAETSQSRRTPAARQRVGAMACSARQNPFKDGFCPASARPRAAQGPLLHGVHRQTSSADPPFVSARG